MRNHRARMGVAVICLAIVAMLAAACGTSSSSTVRTTAASQKVSGTVVVFAAASLKDAAPPLFGASGRCSVLSCGVVIAVEVLVPVAPRLRFPLVWSRRFPR